MSTANIFAAIISLCLFESTNLPSGAAVRRTSLVGYQVADEILDKERAAARAEVLEAAYEEAAARAEVLALRPGLVRIVPEPVVELDEREAQLFADLTGEPAPASERRVVADADAVDDYEIEPCEAKARICDVCKGGGRRLPNGCPRCDGRRIRVWILTGAGREISPYAPARTEEEALGVVCALSDLYPSLQTDLQRAGAHTLFDAVTRKPSARLRHQAIAQWTLGARNAAFAAQVAGGSERDQEAVSERWAMGARS